MEKVLQLQGEGVTVTGQIRECELSRMIESRIRFDTIEPGFDTEKNILTL